MTAADQIRDTFTAQHYMVGHNARLDALEALVDRMSLSAAVGLLAEVASAKADHIRETWQDEALADAWDRQAARLIAVAETLEEGRR